MVTTFTYKPSLVRIDARNFDLSWPTHTQTHTHPQTNRQDRLQYTALQLVRSVNIQNSNRTSLPAYYAILFHFLFSFQPGFLTAVFVKLSLQCLLFLFVLHLQISTKLQDMTYSLFGRINSVIISFLCANTISQCSVKYMSYHTHVLQ